MMNVPVSQKHTGKKRKINAKLRRITVTSILIPVVAASLFCSSMAKAVASGEQENRFQHDWNCFGENIRTIASGIMRSPGRM